MIPANFEARRFGDTHQAEFLARWCGGVVRYTEPATRSRPWISSADGKVRVGIGDWIIRSADGTVRVEPPGTQDGYCADCGEPVWWHDARLVTRGGSRWCYGPGGLRHDMDRWHALPGMDQYIVPAGEGKACRCLAKPWPHIHQIVPVPDPAWQEEEALREHQRENPGISGLPLADNDSEPQADAAGQRAAFIAPAGTGERWRSAAEREWESDR